jgi:DNA-binding transcriptional regulator YiaG
MNDVERHLTFGQLVRWLAYGSPSKDAGGTIGTWLRLQFAAWKGGHNIEPAESRLETDPSPSKIGIAEIRRSLGWSLEEFAETFGFDPALLRAWTKRRKMPEGRDYLMLLAIRRAIEALLKDPEPLSSATNEIGRAAEEGTLQVYGSDKDGRVGAVPRIDFNGGQFEFSPTEDEAALVVMVNVPGGKKKKVLWRALRFERASARASFPKLMNSDCQTTTEPRSVLQSEHGAHASTTAGALPEHAGAQFSGIDGAEIQEIDSEGRQPISSVATGANTPKMRTLLSGSEEYLAVLSALTALAEKKRQEGRRPSEGERRATANSAAGRRIRREDVRIVWPIAAPDMQFMGRGKPKQPMAR